MQAFAIRHGETAWNLTGQHIGTTDTALTENGCRLAKSVALFAHGHLLRVLVARWIALPAVAGRHFLLDTGTLCVLGHYGDCRRQDLERAACRRRQP